MRLAILGTGYVGLVSGACFAELGFDVTCVDKDESKIQALNKGKVPFFEPNLHEYINVNINRSRLHFSSKLESAVSKADIVLITVGTPSHLETGQPDLKDLFFLLEMISSLLTNYKIIVLKSTIPIGTTRQADEYLRLINPKANFDIVINPEFLREGSAIQDFMKPDRIVIGTESHKAATAMRNLYHSFIYAGVPFIEATLETTELIKYAANAFLATKISFINQIADLCEKCHGDIRQVAMGIGLDHRIGKEFLNVGPGFGGSCFPKDMKALIQTSNSFDVSLPIVEVALKFNHERKHKMVNYIMSALGEGVQGKTIAVLGLTFKANTDDLRESVSLTIIPALSTAGATIKAYDPKGMESAQKLFLEINFVKTAYEAIREADALLILTEWEEFKKLDLKQVKNLMKNPVIIDLRNIFTIEEMSQHGFMYYSLGHSPLLPLKREKFKGVVA